MYTQEN